MKTKHVLITLLLFISSIVLAQEKQGSNNKKNTDTLTTNNRTSGITNTYVIKYNFKSKVFDRNNLAPQINHPVVFQINNINRLAYDIIITSKDSSLTKGVESDEMAKKSDTLKKIKNVEITSVINNDILNIDFDEKLYKAVATDNKQKDQLNNLIETDKNIKATLKDLEYKLDKAKSNNLYYKSELKKREKDSILDTVQIDSLKFKITAFEKDLNDINSSIREKKREKDTNASKIDEKNLRNKKIAKLLEQKEIIYTTYREILKNARCINEIFQKNNMLLSIARNPQINSPKEFDKVINDSANGFQSLGDITSYRQKVDNLNSLYSDIKKQVSDLRLDDNELKNDADLKSVYTELIKTIEELLSSVKDIEAKINSKNPHQVITNMIGIMNHLKNPSTYKIVSAPIQPTQDLVIFNINIKSKKDNEYKDERKFTYKEYTKGGVRYDFSTGLVLGFGVNDYTFSTETSNNLEYISERTNTNQFSPSIAAMLHVSFRTQRLVSVGFSLGASLNTTELDINSLYPGISLLVGKTEKFIFTVGPALKKIQYLKSDFEIGKTYPIGTLPKTYETEPTFRQGWFVGITYNLTNKQKSNYSIVK